MLSPHRSDLAPGTIYAHLDDALWAATCLCGLHPHGVTIYGTTLVDLSPDTGEAYRIACADVRADGTTWPVPDAPYAPLYTLTRSR